MPTLSHTLSMHLSALFFLYFVSGQQLMAEDPPIQLTANKVEFFEKQVRPLLIAKCTSCHGLKKQRAGLRLDTAQGLKQGADTGQVVIAGSPQTSSLIQSVKRKGDYPMPPDQPLSAEEVSVLEHWVKDGAVFPDSSATARVEEDWRSHWAFQPLTDPKVSGSGSPIDSMISKMLDKRKLAPTPRADKRTLARRAYFDLIGLPPTADELDAFEKDTSPDAYDKLLDQLLASPHYGERWGRHWLDVARYADSKGYVFQEDRTYPFAYTYRDYVIRSFNEDKPIDRFIIEQLAADKLDLAEDNRALAAMGFLTVGRRFSNNIHDIIDDRIDVVTRGLMGLTVTCARCHDHKFDPIPAADYYSLYGVFASGNEPNDLPVIGGTEDEDAAEKFRIEHERLTTAVEDETARRLLSKKTGVVGLVGGLGFDPPERRLLNRVDRNAVKQLEKLVDKHNSSASSPPRAMVIVDNPRPTEPVVFLRGNPGNRGQQVPRRLPQVVHGNYGEPFTNGSGRLELAKAIASKENPLTARVFVNRVWAWHFGSGLVPTTSDFGVRTEKPSHPELLDWLAMRFVEDGWSLKKLHKRIMLSDAYTRSSVADQSAMLSDPDNKWLSHYSRQRLDFEGLRDSILSVAGTLDRKVYGKSVDLFVPPVSKRRAVYGFIDRQNLPGTLRAFDFASPEQHTPQRFQTTVPQQSLYLLNSPFVIEAVRAISKRVELSPAVDDTEKVKKMYRVVLSRSPTTNELDLAVVFVEQAEELKTQSGQLSAWEQLAQVLLMSNEFAFVD